MPQSSRTIEIQAFVKGSQIDPIFFESSYFALPEKDNAKPYVLLVKALEDSDRVGIAKVTMHLREYTVFIRPRSHGLTVHTMYFVNEIRSVEGYGKLPEDVKLKPQEIKARGAASRKPRRGFQAAEISRHLSTKSEG